MDTPPTVYVSGLHCGPNPSPGVGVARSLRAAFPGARLVGVDYSVASSGIHSDAFCDVWIQRPWAELDLDLYAEQIRNALSADGSVWVSGLDLEVRWLAEALGSDRRLLIPPVKALQHTEKPRIRAAKYLSARRIPYISASRSVWDIYAFCRRHGWPVWCKGPDYEAKEAANWRQVLTAIDEVGKTWSTEDVFVQKSIRGQEVSIAFCAFQGALLDAVLMEKRVQTPEGKTWSAIVADVPEELEDGLARAVKDLGWTGGAEIELVRDEKGSLHAIDWNPRFPAWIYGATLAGHNLPAKLVEAAGVGKAAASHAVSHQFTRVVLEVPVSTTFPLHEPTPFVERRLSSDGKHPSGMPALAKRLDSEPTRRRDARARIPAMTLEDIADARVGCRNTPSRIFLPKTARAVYERAESVVAAARAEGVSTYIAYSVKTNPNMQLVGLALRSGMLAEVITGAEFAHACACGFQPDQIILNGPAQHWPEWAVPRTRPFAVFADSLQRLSEIVSQGVKARYVGIRLRLPGIDSRFGINVGDFEEFLEVSRLLRQVDMSSLGVHFHMQSNVLGIEPWFDCFHSALHWANALEQAADRDIECLDVGGGWFPDDFVDVFTPRLSAVVRTAKLHLGHLRSFIIEPGKALAQPCMALLTRVLEVRVTKAGRSVQEAIVDAAISDLPVAGEWPHRIVALTNRGPIPLPDGPDRLLGRNCMETDILAVRVRLPRRLSRGDWIAICDAGAYDASMAYPFGTGGA